MNEKSHNSRNSQTGEETLRIIANLPAPAGLEDRVRGRLQGQPTSGRVLHWPVQRHSGWMRGVAAAAIVFTVMGGGWGVYRRVMQPRPAKVIAMPQRVVAPGGFSGASAIRTPETLQGPIAPASVTPKPKGLKKPAGPTIAAHKASKPSPAQ